VHNFCVACWLPCSVSCTNRLSNIVERGLLTYVQEMLLVLSITSETFPTPCKYILAVVLQLSHWPPCSVCLDSNPPFPPTPHPIHWSIQPAPVFQPTFAYGLLIALVMEAVTASETLINFYETTWCIVLKVSNLLHSLVTFIT
jgi:hypothetical protein